MLCQVLSPEAKYKQTAGGAMARPNRIEDLKAAGLSSSSFALFLFWIQQRILRDPDPDPTHIIKYICKLYKT